MGGYTGKLLRVNLTEQKLWDEPVSEELKRDWMGGRGWGVKWLWDNLKPGTDPLGPDNALVFLAGPLAGTPAQSAARWKVFFKSPLTGGYFKSSGGGRWAAELKFAGYDGIIVEGKSDKPVYLWLNEGEASLRDASYLWGLDCNDTHELIRQELHDPNIRLACIGPAGEKKVRFSGIFTDRRTAGRGGGGAVMGSKNLKAIAIRGRGKVELGDPEGFKTANQEVIEMLRNNPGYKHFSVVGTQANVDGMQTMGILPTRNFQQGVLRGYQEVNGKAFDAMRVRKTSCYGCMIHCGSITRVSKGKYANCWSEGPEYETIWGYSALIDCNDAGLTVAADNLCDTLGLDTMSCAVTIAFAFELYEKGVLTREDCDGLELTWGNGAAALELTRKIAYREGIGDLLAEGTRIVAKRLGRESEAYAMHVKGLEFPAYDPRGAKAHGLSLMTLDIGADHNSGYAFQELFGMRYKGNKVDRLANDLKGEMTKFNQDYNAVTECAIECGFILPYLRDFKYFGKVVATATGIPEFADDAYLWKLGEKIVNLERMFNVREGFGKKDDTFPARILKETLPAGGSAGKPFDKDLLLADYYKARGWDPETGVPTEAKLRELGLDFAISAIPPKPVPAAAPPVAAPPAPKV